MGIINSTFSNLKVNVTHGLIDTGINAAFFATNYKKRDGQLKFYSHRGYGNVFAYAAKRTMMQMTFATLNDLYPKYLRQLDAKKVAVAFEQNQGKELKKIIVNGEKTDANTYGRENKSTKLKYRSRQANEGLLLWIPSNETTEVTVQTYWDKIKGLSSEQAVSAASMEDTKISVLGRSPWLDLGAMVQVQCANNLVLTRVQGRDYSRKELVSGGDLNFTVNGQITSNYPDIYPYAEVSKFIELMQYKGIIRVYNLLFQQLHVTQILIKDWQLNQKEGFKNVQPYSFSCVAVEPDGAVRAVEDTIQGANMQIKKMSAKSGWGKMKLEEVKSAAANKAAQTLESLTASII